MPLEQTGNTEFATSINIVKRHAWKFHVKANHQVTFAGEEGDDLPPLPM